MSAWNLAFPAFISPTGYGICVKILIMNPTGIFQRATKRARILLKDNLQSGAAVVSTITSYFYLVLRSIFAFS